MPDYVMGPIKGKRDVTMSIAAYERLQDRLIKLSRIESAARTLVGFHSANSVVWDSRPMIELRRALLEYDGWAGSESEVLDVIDAITTILHDLEERDD